MKGFIQYFYTIKSSKVVLWCYLIWYVTIVYFYFDASPTLWINSLGISAVIGTGLMFSVSSGKGDNRDPWQTMRLYLMPFCVSSFSALIKERGFIIFLSPKLLETTISVLSCVLFLSIVFAIKFFYKQPSTKM